MGDTMKRGREKNMDRKRIIDADDLRLAGDNSKKERIDLRYIEQKIQEIKEKNIMIFKTLSAEGPLEGEAAELQEEIKSLIKELERAIRKIQKNHMKKPMKGVDKITGPLGSFLRMIFGDKKSPFGRKDNFSFPPDGFRFKFFYSDDGKRFRKVDLDDQMRDLLMGKKMTGREKENLEKRIKKEKEEIFRMFKELYEQTGEVPLERDFMTYINAFKDSLLRPEGEGEKQKEKKDEQKDKEE